MKIFEAIVSRFVLIVVLGALLFGFAGAIVGNIHSFRTDVIADTKIVTTNGTETSKAVTLSRELMGDVTTEIQSITSNISETIVAGTFTAPDSLQLTNLTPGQTRTVTITYNSESQDEPKRLIGPFLVVGIIGAIVAAIGYSIYRGK